jgi:cyclopropane fatty-acyl-phospholipid synthase-like methyltransferase
MAEAAEAGTAFDEAKAGHAYPEGFEDGFWAIARHRILDEALRDAAAAGLRSTGGRILEIGCGPGIVVQAMRAAGHDAWGVELGSPAIRAKSKPYVVTGTPAQALDSAAREAVETIMLLDVIEHIEDEVGFLREVLPAFPNCRCVVVTVPARQEAWSNYDEYYGHYRRYDRDGLAATLTGAGLQPWRNRYFFRALYVAARLINLTGRKREVVLTRPRMLPLQRLIATLFTIEDKALGALPLAGMSLLAVAKREA